MELDWLEIAAHEQEKTKPKKGPPPIPGAKLRAPPMPVQQSVPAMKAQRPSTPPKSRASSAAHKAAMPQPRHTMDVDMRELLIVPAAAPPAILKVGRPAAKPIPREEAEESPRASRPPASHKPGPMSLSWRTISKAKITCDFESRFALVADLMGDGRWNWKITASGAIAPMASGIVNSTGAAKHAIENFLKKKGYL